MAHFEFLEQLFRTHLTDLKSVFSGEIDVFICPICMGEFPQEDIYKEKLSDGHVWPYYLREKSGSALATSHRVLLCKACNSMAGSRGDKQMQLREQINDGEKTGQYYSERRIEIVQTTNQEPILLNARVAKTGELDAQFTFHIDEKHSQWKRNNPSEQKRFLSLMQSDEIFSVIVMPTKGVDPVLARTGWLTSAYLLAFYTFGYRYIFHKSLDSVRNHIFDSFKNTLLEFPQTDTISVDADETDYFPNPQLRIEIPLNGNIPVHVQVSFFDCHIKLPFPGVPDIFSRVMYQPMKDIEPQLPQLIKQGMSIRIPVICTKSIEHNCVWDYIFGKPL